MEGQDPKPDWEDGRFGNALLELRALRSQLHYAADYCETAFLNAKHKKKVVENTKEYICNAMITVVDHLGSVSANLECLLTYPADPSQADLRINTLQQRLITCQEYHRELDLAKVRYFGKFPRYHPRYTCSKSIPSVGGSDALIIRDSILAPSVSLRKIERRQSAPAGSEFFKELSVLEGPSILSKPRTSFKSQTRDSKKVECHEQRKKELQSINFLPFLRRTKKRVV